MDRTRLWLLALLLAALAVRAVPLFYYGYIDPDHYYHERLSRQFVAEEGVPLWDEVSYGGRPYTYYPLYHELLALPTILFGLDAQAAYAVASLLFALAGLFAAYALVRGVAGERVALAALLVLALSPLAFVRTTVFSRPDGLAFALLALLALAVQRGRLGALLWLGAGLALADLPGALFGLGVFGAWALLATRRREESRFAFGAALFLLISLVYYASLPWERFQVTQVHFSSEELRGLDLLSMFAFGGVAWLFAALGVRAARRESWARAPAWAWAWLALGVLAIAAAIRNLAFVALPAALFAGLGVAQALDKTRPYGRWVAAMVVAGLLVQGVVYYDSLKPVATPELEAALRWARVGTLRSSVFLSLWDRGHLITGVADRPVVMDGYFEFAPQVDERHAGVVAFFFGDERTAVSVMRRWRASYVLVDDRMSELLPGSTALRQLDGWNSFVKAYENGRARVYWLRPG
jgi:4-amino-4-deoxy-L-arabinose transferase-like glycosyltransferase